jgi:hypothetical protein
MRQASKRVPDSAEKTVRDIRRATRRHHFAEETSRSPSTTGRARSLLRGSRPSLGGAYRVPPQQPRRYSGLCGSTPEPAHPRQGGITSRSLRIGAGSIVATGSLDLRPSITAGAQASSGSFDNRAETIMIPMRDFEMFDT